MKWEMNKIDEARYEEYKNQGAEWEEIEEILDEGYFKTGDEVEIIIIRNNNPTKVKLKLIDPHEK